MIYYVHQDCIQYPISEMDIGKKKRRIRMRKKTLVSILLTAALVGTLVTGCGSTEQASSSDSAAAPVTICQGLFHHFILTNFNM